MSAQRRFAVGDCYAVVSETAVVLLPTAERARVAALWELADSGASPEALLDALLAGGLSGVRDLAWVGEVDGTTRLIVRGAATATLSTASGDRVVRATTGMTWQEESLAGTPKVHLALAADDEPVEHALMPGIARVAAIEWGTSPGVTTLPALQDGEPVLEELVPDAEVLEEPVVETPFMQEPFSEPEPEPVVETSMGVTGQPADPPPTGEIPAVADDEWSDRDGQTTIGVSAPDFDRPPIPGQEIVSGVIPHPVASLVFSTGDVIEVDRTVLIGRAPEAHQFASHDQPRVVTVSSPHQEISSTHVEIRPGAGADHGSAIATDLGSTNGTMLVQPGLEPEELQPGIAVSLIPGAVLDLGDGVTIQVTDP